MPSFSAGGRTHNRAGVNRPNFGWPGLRVRHAGVHSYPLRWVGRGGGKMNVEFKSKKKPTQPTLETFPTATPIPSPMPCSHLHGRIGCMLRDRCIWDEEENKCLSKTLDLNDNGTFDVDEKAFYADLSSKVNDIFGDHPLLHVHHNHSELVQELLELYKAGHRILCPVISVEGKYSIARHDKEQCDCPTLDNPNECFSANRILNDLNGNPIYHDNQQFNHTLCKSVTVRGGDAYTMTLYIHPLEIIDIFTQLDTISDGVLTMEEAFQEVSTELFEALDGNHDGVLTPTELTDMVDVNKDGLVSGTELSNFDKGFIAMKKLLKSATDPLGIPEFLITNHDKLLAVELSKALKLHKTAGTTTEYPLLLNLNCGHTNARKHGCGNCDSHSLVHTDLESNQPILSQMRLSHHGKNELDTCLTETILIDGYDLSIHLSIEFIYFETIPDVIHCWELGDIGCSGISTEQWLKTDMPSVLYNVEEAHGDRLTDALVTINVPASSDAGCVNEAWLIEAMYHPLAQNTLGCMSSAVCIMPTWDVHLNEAIEDGAITCVEEIKEHITLYLQVRLENNSTVHLLFITKGDEMSSPSSTTTPTY